MTLVPASIVSENGLNEPPPPAIETLVVAVTTQPGCGLGLREGLGEGVGVWASVSPGLIARKIALIARMAAERIERGCFVGRAGEAG